MKTEGDKWLMNRYQMSEESLRMSRGRRSLSFTNVSGGYNDNCRTRNNYFNNGLKAPSTYSRQNGNSSHAPNRDGAFKKLLNRTKSLIFKRGSDGEDQMESVSTAVSMSDVWGSHDSIVDMEYTPSHTAMRNKGPQSRRDRSPSIISDDGSSHTLSNDNDNQDRDNMISAINHLVPPAHPPPPPPGAMVSKKGKERSGGKSVKSNVSPVPPREEDDIESCIVISDHLMRTPSNAKSYPHDSYSSHTTYSQKRKSGKKSSGKKTNGKQSHVSSSTNSNSKVNEEIFNRFAPVVVPPKQESKVSRVESFNEEPPIIPNTKNIVVNTATSNGHHKPSTRSQKLKKSLEQSFKEEEDDRREIIRPHPHRIYKDEEDEEYFEEQEQSQIFTNVNDEFDDEEDEDCISSSVFMDDDEEDDKQHRRPIVVDVTVENKGAKSQSRHQRVMNAMYREKEIGSSAKNVPTPPPPPPMPMSEGPSNGGMHRVATMDLMDVSSNKGEQKRSRNGETNSNNGRRKMVMQQIQMQQAQPKKKIVSSSNGSLVRSNGQKGMRNGSASKGSKMIISAKGNGSPLRSEFRSVELITSGGSGDPTPFVEYGSHIRRRLYFPEGISRIDQKSERSGNMYGPWCVFFFYYFALYLSLVWKMCCFIIICIFLTFQV